MPAPHDLDPGAMTEEERLEKRRYQAYHAFETDPSYIAEPMPPNLTNLSREQISAIAGRAMADRVRNYGTTPETRALAAANPKKYAKSGPPIVRIAPPSEAENQWSALLEQGRQARRYGR